MAGHAGEGASEGCSDTEFREREREEYESGASNSIIGRQINLLLGSKLRELILSCINTIIT